MNTPRATREYVEAMQALRRSSAAQRHRDKSKYARKDERRSKQRGYT